MSELEWDGRLDGDDEYCHRPETTLIVLADTIAKKHGLDPALVCALCEVESAWMPWAARYESGYKWLYIYEFDDEGYPYINLSAGKRERGQQYIKFLIQLGCSGQTEVIHQKISWGLMQIMGATARERGFRGWLTELCDPQVNLEWGCKHLRWMLDHANDYGIEMIGSSPGAFGQHTPPAHTAYQSFDPNLVDLAAAWNGGKRRRSVCSKCAGRGVLAVEGDSILHCDECRGTGKAYANQSYVDRVVRAIVNYE